MRVFLCGRGDVAVKAARKLQLLGFERNIVLFTEPGDDAIEGVKPLLIRTVTESINNEASWPWVPDMIVSIGYLKIIKQHVLQAVGGCAINCHYALLPNHRGRSAVPWAILDGDTYSGITWHWIDTGIDTGNILFQAAAQIDADETQATLFQKLHDLVIWHLTSALHLAKIGGTGVPQTGKAQYHPAGPPNGGVINPDWAPVKVERFIRAMTYPPLPYAMFEGQEVKTFDQYMRMRYGRKYEYTANRDHNLAISG